MQIFTLSLTLLLAAIGPLKIASPFPLAKNADNGAPTYDTPPDLVLPTQCSQCKSVVEGNLPQLTSCQATMLSYMCKTKIAVTTYPTVCAVPLCQSLFPDMFHS